jgi:predicted transcriptional regulator
MTDTNLITDANNLLDEAVELVEVTNEETYQEAYEPVMDAYPDVVLPASTIDAIHCNESLSALQEQIEYLACELQAVQSKLQDQITSMMNDAKAELMAAEHAANEEVVMQALAQPDVMRVLAEVITLLQSDKAGALLDVITELQEGDITSAQQTMLSYVTPAAPIEATPYVEPTRPAPTTTSSSTWSL